MNGNNKDADDRILENVSELPKMELSLFRMMAEYQVPVTINNIRGMKMISDTPEDIFEDVESEELLTALESREELLDAYEKLAKEAKKNLTDNLYENIKTIDINSMKMISTGMNIISHMAGRNNYYIPCNDGDNRVIINLKIIENTEENGKFQITFANEKYGKVSVEGKITGETINVQMLSDTVEGIGNLTELMPTLENKLREIGFESVKISGNRSDERPVMHPSGKDDISTKMIFKAAKIFISELTN